MAKERVAFLGPDSSYSHQAVISNFPATEFEYLSMVTFRDIFNAVQSGEVSRGIVPFENSTNGSVVAILDLLADRLNLYPDIVVCSEVYLKVHHCLLGYPPQPKDLESAPIVSSTASLPALLNPRAAPLASLNHIERIYSHPQAFGQCEIFLGAYLKGIERIDVSSTSRAAQLVKADTTGSSTAIASQVASDVHGLAVLANGIEDDEDNTTRFFILKRSNDIRSRESIHEHEGETPHKSLVSFTVDHSAPRALVDVLECFGRYNLNLTSMSSRPGRVLPFQYIFLVEFEGSRLHDSKGNVGEALHSVERVAKSYRWLGSWSDKLRK